MAYVMLHCEATMDLVEVPGREVQFRQAPGATADFLQLQGKFMLAPEEEGSAEDLSGVDGAYPWVRIGSGQAWCFLCLHSCSSALCSWQLLSKWQPISGRRGPQCLRSADLVFLTSVTDL